MFKANLQVEILGSPAIHCSISKLQLDHITSHPRRQYFRIEILLTFKFSVQSEEIICFVCILFSLQGECFVPGENKVVNVTFSGFVT